MPGAGWSSLVDWGGGLDRSNACLDCSRKDAAPQIDGPGKPRDSALPPDKQPQPDNFIPPDGTVCPPGTIKCSLACVNPQSNPQHCNGCNQSCGGGVCSQGKCCPATMVSCGGICVDTSSSVQHCGGCNQPCGGGVCSLSKCCPTGQVNCAGACANTLSSVQHCGGCNQPCASGNCSQGKCCPAGQVNCSGTCVDTSSSTQHCGSCNNPCTGTVPCVTGKCMTTSTSACQDGTDDQTFQGGMVGCAGSVSFSKRQDLCAATHKPCTAAQWVTNRGGAPPTHNYWTNDVLYASYYGASSYCKVRTQVDYFCSTDRPMRVCVGHKDTEGNTCNWINCGLNDYKPPQYFGGCVTDPTAGTLCCP